MERFCTIILCTYNRKRFEKLIEHNINTQDYPFIHKIIIADDGNEDERLNLNLKYPIEYHKVKNRMTIGAKRNFLLSKCETNFIAVMDTDDIYNKSYISTSIYNMIQYGKFISGSADMQMYYMDKTYIHRCSQVNMYNEATLVFLNTHRKFGDTSTGEGKLFLNDMEQYSHETNIKDIMICGVHPNNTVNKSGHLTQEIELDLNFQNGINIFNKCIADV